MTTLAEIETAAEALPEEQKRELFVFLVKQLHGEAASTPPPRQFTREQMDEWIAQDEADMRRFNGEE